MCFKGLSHSSCDYCNFQRTNIPIAPGQLLRLSHLGYLIGRLKMT